MKPRILVIDDEPRIRLLYQKELEREGYVVEVSPDGSHGIARCRESSFDVVVLDIEMPDMSGLDVLARLREISPRTRIVLNSAYTIYKSDFQSWLADAYVVKSSDIRPLKERLTELVTAP